MAGAGAPGEAGPREAARLAALRRYGILDTQPEPAFDDLAFVAASACGTPIAAITLVDEHRQWFKSILGLPVRETSRDLSFCAHTIVEHDVMVVPDALLDPRFASNPLVTSEPHIRFYAGAPIVTLDGHALGTICVVDRVPRTLTDAQLDCLRALARQAMSVMELKRQLAHRTDSLADTLTARERDDLALREKEAQLHVVVDHLPASVWTVDRDLVITASVGRGLAAFGLVPGQLVGMPLEEFLSADADREVPLAAHRAALAGEPTGYSMEFRGRPYEVRIEPLRDATGAIAGAVGLALDVLEKRKAQDALAEWKARYEAATIASGQVLYDHDDRTDVITWGGDTANVLGVAAAEMPRSLDAWLRLVHADDRVQFATAARARKAPGVSYHHEYRVTRPDGSVIWLRDHGADLYGGDGSVRSVGFLVDVTETKRLEEQLRHSQKMEAVGRLAGGVAHDFNNVLTAILGYSDLLLASVAEHELRQHVEEIRRAGERAASLTSQLLAFSRKQMLAPRVLDLNALVSDLQKMLRRVIGEDVELATLLLADPARVRADPGQLEHVVMNLAINARDAMPSGGRISISTSTVVLEGDLAGRVGPHVLLCVADTGSGMDEKTRSRLFEPFFTTKERGKGTGLGLATSYGIVKQSGGEIAVESRPGEGTRIRVYLPLADEDVEKTPTGGFPALKIGGSETVLVVEDEAAVGSLARKVLQSNGYTVLQAAAADEAIETARRHEGPLHLLLTDVVMPGLSGRELAERLRASRPEMKVLYMSGYTDDAMVRHGLGESATSFLQKPFNLETLLSRVRETLDRPRRPSSHGTPTVL